MTDLVYYCAAKDCDAVGVQRIGGRLLCGPHVTQLKRCSCPEGEGQYLLPGETCEKCGGVNETE